MRIPSTFIDYAQDEVYGFGSPFFFPLDIHYARSIVTVACYGDDTVSTTIEFLQLYEDTISAVGALRAEWEADHKGICPDDLPDIIRARQVFREKTDIFKSWPLPQLQVSALYRTLIDACCPYQEMVWNRALNSWPSSMSNKEKEKQESLFSENPDKALREIYTYCTPEKLQKMKEVKPTTEVFWSRIFSGFFLGTQNQKLSLEIVDLFLAFATRNESFKREVPALRETFLDSIRRTTFARDYPKTPLFYSFVLIPLFDYFGISSLRSRIAFLEYAETRNISLIQDLFTSP
jgi:hypothetical protein